MRVAGRDLPLWLSELTHELRKYDHTTLACVTARQSNRFWSLVCVGRYSRRFIEKMAGDFWSKGTRHSIPAAPHLYARVHGSAVCMRAGVIGCEEITLPMMKFPSFHSASSQV